MILERDLVFFENKSPRAPPQAGYDCSKKKGVHLCHLFGFPDRELVLESVQQLVDDGLLEPLVDADGCEAWGLSSARAASLAKRAVNVFLKLLRIVRPQASAGRWRKAGRR